MSFSYGSFYGMTGIHALFADVGLFATMLKSDNLSTDTRESLINLYSEVVALKQVFDVNNVDPTIPHVSVAVDKDSVEAINFLRGYNNYLNYKRMESENLAVTNDEISIDDLDSIDLPTEDSGHTNVFVSDISTDDSGLGLDADLDMDMNMDLDMNADFDLDLNAEQPMETQEEKTLFSTYNQLYDYQTDTIDLIAWGKLYSESDTCANEEYVSLAWGPAMKEMKKNKSDPHTADFIAQRKKLPTTVVNCSMSAELKSMICKTLGVNSSFCLSPFEERFALKFLAEVYARAMEPTSITFGEEPKPRIDLLLELLCDAINAPSNVYVQRFGISMCDLALWNSRTVYSLNHQIDNILKTLLIPVCTKTIEGNAVISVISKLIDDCDLLLGVNNEDVHKCMSTDAIEILINDCEFNIPSTYTYCEKFLQVNSDLDISIIPGAAELLTKFITYCFSSEQEDAKASRQAIYTLLQSQENLIFLTNVNAVLEAAIEKLRIVLVTTYRECEGETAYAPIDVDTSAVDLNEQLQVLFVPLFKNFTLHTGLWGCSLCYFDKMFATAYQMRPAVMSVSPVKFINNGFEQAREAILLLKGHLKSLQHRVNKMCGEV